MSPEAAPASGRQFAMGSASRAIVAGSSGREALRAAAAALRAGGTAADAAVAAALAQTVLAAGCWVSHAGILAALYHDAAEGKTHSLNAAFGVPRLERDPLSIRAAGRKPGRAILVPGFMAGAAALQGRFGRRSFADALAPAIRLADEGFSLDLALHGLVAYRRDLLTSTAEGREIFLRPDGELHAIGELLRQPRLASTLRRVAAEGPDHMYLGEWARAFVAAVARRGGRLDARDLAEYRARWSEPLRCDHRGLEVLAPALPALGGAHVIEALRLLEEADVRRWGPPAASAEALFRLIQVTRAARLGPDLPIERRLTPEAAARLWREIERRRGLTYASRLRMRRTLAHTDAVVVVDAAGNVAVLCHSINALPWASGLFVEGVSIPDSASFQQLEMAQAGPGARLPDLMNPVLLTRNRRPELAAVAIGASLHEAMIQGLAHAVDLGLTLGELKATPRFLVPLPTPIDGLLGVSGKRLQPLGALLHRLIASGAAALGMPSALFNPPQAIDPVGFTPGVLAEVAAMGQPLRAVPDSSLDGYWTGVRFASGGTPLDALASNGPYTDPTVIGES